MAQAPGADAVYEVADLFRQRCLVEGRSFLWPDQYVWNADNLRKTWDAMEQNDSTSEPQLNDLLSPAEALSKQPSSIQMIATDVLAAGCLFPAVKRSTQEKYLRGLLNAFDVPEVDTETWQKLVAIFEIEVPGSFTHYKGGKTQNYLSWLFGLMLMTENANSGRNEIVRIIQEESAKVGAVWDTLIWGLLHTMYPDQFVAVPGNSDRKRILKAFAPRLEGHSFDNDFAALNYLRETLPAPDDDQNFDFYDPHILKLWNPRHKRIGWLAENQIVSVGDVENLDDIPSSDGISTTPTLAPLVLETHLSSTFLREIDSLIKDKRQLIFEGPPGSGKTFVADKFARWFTDQRLTGEELNEQVEIVQFHQSYGYEDFVQGIRPETNDDGQLVYSVRDGIFLDMCERAIANPDKPFVLIIDEINRGNLSRIFGELLLLLEYRDKSVRLPYGSGDSSYLKVPKNLYIIGTMNTADRSLAQIDYALRRRFYFVRFMPVENGRAEVFESWLATQNIDHVDQSRLLRLFVTLNHGIREHLNTDDLQVGHSYFMTDDIATEAGFDRVWTRAVEPLLNEYLHHHRDRDEILKALMPANLARETVEADPENEESLPEMTDDSGQDQ